MNRIYIPPKEEAFDTKILARISEDNAAQVVLKKQKIAKDKIDAIREKKMLDDLFVV